jgi:hypothetical protein
MTVRQSAKLRMYLAVVALCNRPEFAAATAAIPAFAAALRAFLAMPETIKAARKLQKASTKGITGSKLDNRIGLTKIGNRIGAALTSFADAEGRIELRGEAADAAIPLDRGSETAAAARAEMLLELASPHSEILVREYGLKETDLADFDAYITSFSEASGRPRTTISLRASATKVLKNRFLEADAYLDRMDRLSINLQPDHPDFVLAYKSSRLIGAIPYHTKKDPTKAAAEKQSKADTKAAKKKSPARATEPASNGATAEAQASATEEGLNA